MMAFKHLGYSTDSLHVSITLLCDDEEKLHVFFCFPGAKQNFRYSSIIDVKHAVARTNISGFKYATISKITHFFNISESQRLKEETLIRYRIENRNLK